MLLSPRLAILGKCARFLRDHLRRSTYGLASALLSGGVLRIATISLRADSGSSTFSFFFIFFFFFFFIGRQDGDEVVELDRTKPIIVASELRQLPSFITSNVLLRSIVTVPADGLVQCSI